MLHEYVTETFDLDSKLARSVRLLLLKPGVLTAEYLKDRRTRYVKPFRLYLLASVLLFVVPSMVPVGLGFKAHADRGSRAGSFMITRDDGKPFMGGKPRPPPRDLTPEEIKEENESLAADDGWFINAVKAAGLRVFEDGPKEAERRYNRAIGPTVQKVMFLLVPLFALLLKLLYLRTKQLYVDHLIFALHFSCIQFAICVVALYSWRWPWVIALESAALAAYLFIALRRVYGQSAWLTSLKFVLLTSTYSVLFVGGIAVGAIASIWAA